MSSSVASHPTPEQSEQRKREALFATPGREWAVPVALLLCGAALIAAWRVRDELYLQAEHGLGYALGIAGLTCMVTLLGYSICKRSAALRRAIPLRHSFRVHMVLGILGPTLILLHANLTLGSLNSSVALASMLLVAGSGYVGRFIYSRIHRGLFGRRKHLRDVRREAEQSFGGIQAALAVVPELRRRLDAFERWALAPAGVVAATWRFFTVGLRAHWLARSARSVLRGALPEDDLWYATAAVGEYLQATRRVAQFTAYERLFSLWHAIHLPLCVLLFGAAAAHVVAVHMY